MRIRNVCLLVIVLWLAAACATKPPAPAANLQAVTPVPTLDLSDPAVLCQAVTAQWGHDWPTVIRALDALQSLGALCADGIAIDNHLYTAYVAYGTILEQRGRTQDAIEAYQTALEHDRLGTEATSRLRELNVLTPEPPERCEPGVVMNALEQVTDYTPTEGSFVRIDGDRLVLEGIRYPVYGINYYPRDTPGNLFLTETDIESITFELDILQAAGLNTLRIFVRHDALFTCPGNGAIPIADNLTRLDAFIRAAATRGFKLIITLNDAPDLETFRLYDSPQHSSDQLVFLLTRYRSEPAIMAWDLRDGGDLDYAERRFTREAVLRWLTQTAFQARQTDPNHLITAGWHDDAEATVTAVDFVSFQHFGDFESLRQEIANLRSATDKPILLAAVGFSTYAGVTETMQRDDLFQAFEAVERNNLAGWAVWTAFDYPLTATCDTPDCSDTESAVHHFGLWNTSYFPKLATEAIKAITGAD